MYEYITGKLVELGSNYAIIDCAGVGYHINISLQSYNDIEKQENAKLYIHFIVRDDAQLLYGFSQKNEREIFRLLIGVSGVGSNTARNILSTYTCRDLSSIISSSNDALLKNVKGLGMKTAQKIIVELKDKIVGVDSSASPLGFGTSVNQDLVNEAVAALTMLGFSKNIATKAVNSILKDNPDCDVEALIKLALKKM
ncbi:MAG: Holliday junction branch migration protein RuvA [Rikenellaceae bacterium]